MSLIYHVQVIHINLQDRVTQIETAIADELKHLKISPSTLTVTVNNNPIPDKSRGVALLIADAKTKDDPEINARLNDCINRKQCIIPVIDRVNDFHNLTPKSIAEYNAFEWSGPDPARRLAHVILENLRIEDQNRCVFISHKRSDGAAVAAQLHDRISHDAFAPFIDRFKLRPGEKVQDAIFDTLENFAFLLLLETPEAHKSKWVLDEVEYALTHHMGILIVQWPGTQECVPGSAGFPRLVLKPEDFIKNSEKYSRLKVVALNRIAKEVENEHARAIVRRKKMLLQGVLDIAKDENASCEVIRDWAVSITGSEGPNSVVLVSSRLPTCHDLQRLDEIREETDHDAHAQLVHTAGKINPSRKAHLEWTLEARKLEYLSNHEIEGLALNSLSNKATEDKRSPRVFLSASIPDPNRWKGKFDPFEITDAVVATARVVLAHGGTIITAAHPTVAPLLLYAASGQLNDNDQRIIIYQSRAFKPVLPAATNRFETDGICKIKWTRRINNEPPIPQSAPESLAFMREKMLKESKPDAAFFVGGMQGISDEYRLFHEFHPDAPIYAFGRPGGEAEKLIEYSPQKIQTELKESDVYSTLVRHIINDLTSKIEKQGNI